MDILQSLFSLWTSNRSPADREKIKSLLPEQFTEYCEQIERRAFDVGFKTAIQLCQQLEQTEEIYKEDKP